MEISEINQVDVVYSDYQFQESNQTLKALAVSCTLTENIKELQRDTLDPVTEAYLKYSNNPYGISAMHYAIMEKDLKAVRLFLENGEDANGVSPLNNSELRSALDYAAAYGDADLVDLLVRYGARVDVYPYHDGSVNWVGKNPLHFAAQFDNPETIKALIIHGANRYSDCAGWEMPIHTAAKYNSTKAIEALLEMGTNINVNSQSEGTPLHTAIIHSHLNPASSLETIQFLLENDANPNAHSNIWRWTGLTPICLARDSNIIRLLLGYGADINEKNFDGGTALHYIVEHSCSTRYENESPTWYLDVIKTLIMCGADVNAKNNEGQTLLQVANPRMEDVRKLLKEYEAN